MLLRSVKSKAINMPDGTDHPSRHRVVNLLRHAPSTLKLGERKGGVLRNRNRRRFTVNIRPSKWNEKNKPCKFWIGKQSCGWAQYKADTIFHYSGKPRFHYKDADLVFPLLECMGTEIGTRVLLETQEVRFDYVQSIAGEAFTVHREEFIQKVEEVMESTAFIRQGERLLNSTEEAAAPREEAATVMPGEEEAAAVMPRGEAVMPSEEAAIPKEEAAFPKEAATSREEETATLREVEAAVPLEGVVKNEDDHFEDTPPLEEDPMSFQALREIQFSAALSSDTSERSYPTRVLHARGSGTDSVRALDSSQAYAPSFEINPNSSGKESLQSVGQSFGSMSFSMKDCPETLEKDKEGYRSWMQTVAELDKGLKPNVGTAYEHDPYLCLWPPSFWQEKEIFFGSGVLKVNP